MDKPTKPTDLMPRSFGGLKANWSASMQETGYEPGVPATYSGSNLNYQIDATGKELDYCEKICDFINEIPIGKTITVDNNNKLVYDDLAQTVPIATTSEAGIVKIGNAIDVDNTDGTISVKPATTTTLGGVIIGGGIDVQEDGTISIEPQANQSLSNLTDEGNAKFQHAPFSINSGTTDTSGENATLHVPAGAQTDVEVAFEQPILSANGTVGGDSFAAFASGEWNTNTPAWKAFDGVKDDLLNAWIARTYSPAYLGCYSPQPLKLYGVYFTNTYECPTVGIIQVSNDGVTWTDAQTYTNSNTALGATWYVRLETPVANVQYVRNYITAPVGGIPRIAEMTLDATIVVSVASGTTVICDACTITTVNSKSKTFPYDSVLDCSDFSDGTYKIYKNYQNGNLSVGDYTFSNDDETAMSLYAILLSRKTTLPLSKGILTTKLSNKGILSKFSVDNCAELPITFNPSTNNWEMNLSFTTGSDITTAQTIYNEANCIDLSIDSSSNLLISLGGGSSFDILSAENIGTVTANTDYAVKITYDGTNYVISVNGTTEHTETSATTIGAAVGRIGLDNSDANPFLGKFNLPESYIKIGSDTVWSGKAQNDYVYMGTATVSSGNVTAISNVPFNVNRGDFSETYSNGSSWYRVYSDGWCEQGGQAQINSEGQTVSLLKNFANTNYYVGANGLQTQIFVSCYTKTTSNFKVYTGDDNTFNSSPICWRACGYIR